MQNNEAATKQTGGKGKISPRWKPGESGNPAGRPKPLPDIKRTVAKEILRHSEAGYSPMEVVVTNLFNNAISGDTEACIRIIDLAYPNHLTTK